MRLTYRLAALAIAVSLAGAALAPAVSQAVSPTSAESSYANYTVEQLEQLIAKLQKQLAEMKANQVKCFVSEHDLSLGDGEGDDLSDDVRRLQDFLREKGYFTYKSTGYFGKITRTGVIAFQKAVGVAETGMFDAATRAKAHALSCTKALAKKAEVKEKEKDEKKPEAKASPVSSITLTGSDDEVSWTAVGKSPQGFKVVWSKNAAPTYPTRDDDQYLYFESPNAHEAKLSAFDGAGAYRVRVCEYLGGKCGVYSNEITVTLE